MKNSSDINKNCLLFRTSKRLIIVREGLHDSSLFLLDDAISDLTSHSISGADIDVDLTLPQLKYVGDAILEAFVKDDSGEISVQFDSVIPEYVKMAGFMSVQGLWSACHSCSITWHTNDLNYLIFVPLRYDPEFGTLESLQHHSVTTPPNATLVGQTAHHILTHDWEDAEIRLLRMAASNQQLRVAEYHKLTRNWTFKSYANATFDQMLTALNNLDQEIFPYFSLQSRRTNGESNEMTIMGGNGNYYIVISSDGFEKTIYKERRDAGEVVIRRDDSPYAVERRSVVSFQEAQEIIRRFYWFAALSPQFSWLLTPLDG